MLGTARINRSQTKTCSQTTFRGEHLSPGVCYGLLAQNPDRDPLAEGCDAGNQPQVRQRWRRQVSYGAQVISILQAVWEAADYLWSMRLKARLLSRCLPPLY